MPPGEAPLPFYNSLGTSSGAWTRVAFVPFVSRGQKAIPPGDPCVLSRPGLVVNQNRDLFSPPEW